MHHWHSSCQISWRSGFLGDLTPKMGITVISTCKRFLIVQKNVMYTCRSLRSVHPFLHSSPFTQPQKLWFTMLFDRPDTSKVPRPWGHLHPHLIHGFLYHQTQHPKLYVVIIQPFLHSARRTESPYTSQWDVTSPVKIAPSHGALDHHLTHGSLGPPKSTAWTASRSVQLLLQGSRSWETDRQTTILHLQQ